MIPTKVVTIFFLMISFKIFAKPLDNVKNSQKNNSLKSRLNNPSKALADTQHPSCTSFDNSKYPKSNYEMAPTLFSRREGKPEEIETNYAAQCALDLCGPPSNRPNIYLTQNNYTKFAKPEALNRYPEIQPKINYIVQYYKIDNQNFINAFTNLYSSGNYQFNFSSWSPDEYQQEAESIMWPYILTNVDYNLPISDRLTFSFKYPPNAGPNLAQGLAAFAQKYKERIMSSFTSMSVDQRIYKISEAQVRFKIEFYKFYNSFLDKRKYDSEFMKENLITIEALRSKLDNIVFSDYISFYDEVVSSAFNLLSEGNACTIFDCDGFKLWFYGKDIKLCELPACQIAVQEYINSIDIAAMMNSLQVANNDPTLTAEGHALCKSKLASYYLKPLDTQIIESRIPELKQSFMNDVMFYFSQHSQDVFKNYLVNIVKFVFPNQSNNNSGNVDDFISAVNQKYNQLQTLAQENYSNKNSNYFFKEIFYRFYQEVPFPLRNMGVLCGSTKYSLSSEAFNQNNDTIYSSPFGAVYPEQGLVFLGHEIAHALSFTIAKGKLSESSAEKYLTMRKCATFSSIQSIEESFADMLSYLLKFKKSIKQDPSQNPTIGPLPGLPSASNIAYCSRLEPNYNGSGYTNVTFNVAAKSSDLIRSIKEAIFKNVNLPSSCSILVNDNPEYFKGRECIRL